MNGRGYTSFRYQGTCWLCVGYVLVNPCSYSRVDSIKYKIELIPFETKSLSPTIKTVWGVSLDLKTD